MLVLSLSLALNSSIDINHIIELRNSEISPLVVHIVQTVPLDINFVFWILFVSKVWVEQESAVVSNYRVCVATARLIKADLTTETEESHESF
jgi:hypothetical protein